MDDSMSAIDFHTEALLRKALRNINATKIIIAQRICSIMEADKILLLDDGKTIGYGTHKDLLENNQVYQEFFKSQAS